MHGLTVILTTLLGVSMALAQFAQFGNNSPSYSVSTYKPTTTTYWQPSTTYTTVTTSVCTQNQCTKSSTYTPPPYTPSGQSTPIGTGKPTGSGNGTIPTYTSPLPTQYTGGAAARMAGGLGGAAIGVGMAFLL